MVNYSSRINDIMLHNLLFVASASGVADVAHSTKLDCFTPPSVCTKLVAENVDY